MRLQTTSLEYVLGALVIASVACSSPTTPSSGSATFSLHFTGGCPDGFPSTYSVAGMLTTTAPHLLFTGARAQGAGDTPALRLDMTLKATSLSGTIGGSSANVDGYILVVGKSGGQAFEPATLFGETASAVDMRGTLDGRVGVVHPTFGLEICAGTGLEEWTLSVAAPGRVGMSGTEVGPERLVRTRPAALAHHGRQLLDGTLHPARVGLAPQRSRS
jgi:hypothetical protein